MELKGKKIAFLGDSITEGFGVSDRASCRYDNRLKAMCGLAATYNYGISGTRLAHKSKPSEKPRHDLCFCGRAYWLAPDADVIVVFGGTNDYGHGDAPLGKKGDKTPATFYGAVDFLISFLKETYPAAQLVFMTPARRKNDEKVSWEQPADSSAAHPLLAYVNIMKTVCEAHGVPCLDLYHKLGIDPNVESEREAYAPDGLHFNDAGHAFIAERLKDFLEAL